MRAVLRTILWAILGLLVGAATGVLIGLAWITIFETSSFEGYSAMLVFFGFAPASAMIGMIVLPIWRAMVSKRRSEDAQAGVKSATQS